MVWIKNSYKCILWKYKIFIWRQQYKTIILDWKRKSLTGVPNKEYFEYCTVLLFRVYLSFLTFKNQHGWSKLKLNGISVVYSLDMVAGKYLDTFFMNLKHIYTSYWKKRQIGVAWNHRKAISVGPTMKIQFYFILKGLVYMAFQ